MFTLAAPFDGEPEVLITLRLRYSEIMWGHEGLAIVDRMDAVRVGVFS